MRLLQVSMAPAAAESVLEVVTASGARGRFAVGTDVEYVVRLVAALGQ